MLTGAGGMLAHALASRALARGHCVSGYERSALDVTNEAAVRAALLQSSPDAVVQCAAYTRVDDAEHDEAAAYAVNAHAAGIMARACLAAGIRLVYPSTDYVFDGTARVPYAPDAPTAPLNAYGRTKLAGELEAAIADTLIVRTSWLYGLYGRNFVRTIITRARAGEPLRVVDDQCGAPTYTLDLANAILSLLENKAPAGIYHATNAGETTWFGLAAAATEAAGVRADITPVSSREFNPPARRPAYSILDCSSTEGVAGALPHWRDALERAIRAGIA